jgi:RND family efflux transporter MFP subunit
MMPNPSLATRRALAAAVALLAALAGCRQEAPPQELPPRAIRWARVTGSLAGQQRVISGVVTAIDDTSLAFEVGGTVDTVEVELGDSVESGQVLARLDPEPFQLAVSDAEAALAEASAMQALARSTLSRYVEAGKAVAQQEVDRARAMQKARDQQVEAAQARLDLTRRDLRRSVLMAPFQGTISVRVIEPAMTMGPGETAFELDSEESGLRVEVLMPETLIARVHQGDEASVSFPSAGEPGSDAGTRRFPAVVSEVGTRAGAGNAFPVRADLLESPPGLRPGMTAEVRFSILRGEEGLALEGFLIPIAAALPEAGDGFSAFVYDSETSTVNKRPIRTGGVVYNDIVVLEGLAEDEIIATAGVSFLVDGQQVTLLQQELVQNAP